MRLTIIIVGKLNFTGKPFAPDSIFINSIGKNQGDEDECNELDQISEINHQYEKVPNHIAKIAL